MITAVATAGYFSILVTVVFAVLICTAPRTLHNEQIDKINERDNTIADLNFRLSGGKPLEVQPFPTERDKRKFIIGICVTNPNADDVILSSVELRDDLKSRGHLRWIPCNVSITNRQFELDESQRTVPKDGGKRYIVLAETAHVTSTDFEKDENRYIEFYLKPRRFKFREFWRVPTEYDERAWGATIRINLIVHGKNIPRKEWGGDIIYREIVMTSTLPQSVLGGERSRPMTFDLYDAGKCELLLSDAS